MELPIYQVDAFTSELFAGNPAAVVPLETWLDDALMQAVALENNLSETAFFVRDGDDYAVRYFTPAVEVPLCGHATLASAHVLLTELTPAASEVRFRTIDGELLGVVRDGERLRMDFPAKEATAMAVDEALVAALGAPVSEQHACGERYRMAVLDSPQQVAALTPDMRALRELGFAFIATAPGDAAPGDAAPGDDVDFVSRFFAPAAGIDEDPVTGSAHCVLVPYWAKRLGRSTLHAKQISARGGELWCELKGDRVSIAGHAVLYLRGTLEVA